MKDREQSIVIQVSAVSKKYTIYANPQERLKQMLLGRIGQEYGHAFWALEDVSFTVHRGETIGIIGRNGSGKSTLLQIIAGTLSPTVGHVTVQGRVAALLELGSGFNPEFSGRENVFLNGSILGVAREEMEALFEEIVAFADIGEFIDQPVKTYSSGMQARLAFAVGIHVQPDIFIIDEALSVGDIFFQSRCARKLDEYRQQGGTVLFVTHDTYTMERICTRSIVMHHGRKVFEGSNADAANYYYQIERGSDASIIEQAALVREVEHEQVIELRRVYVTGNGDAYIHSVQMYDVRGQSTTTFQVGEWMRIALDVEFKRNLDGFDYGIGIRDRLGVLIGGAHTFHQRQTQGPVQAGERRTLETHIQLSIAPGNYLLLIGIVRNYAAYEWQDFYTMWDCCSIQVVGVSPFWGQVQLNNRLNGNMS